MTRRRFVTLLTLCGLALCGSAAAAPTTLSTTTLTVMTHDSFDIDKKLVAAFEAQNNAKVRFIKGGDAGEMLNRLILTRRAPLADVVYGLDNSLEGRAVSADLLDSYRSPALSKVAAPYRMKALNTVDYAYVALNYDRAWFAKSGLPLPKTLDDLKNPVYARLTVVPSPATSSPGLAFLLATNQFYGTDKAMQWWKDARTNGMKLTRGWSDAYDKEFSRNGGKYPIVLSYASSPAAEVFYAQGFDPAHLPAQAPTANLFLPGSSYLQLEGVGVLKGAKQPALARKFVDFMLSSPVQADFPTRMWVYPAAGGKLNPVYKFAEEPKGVKVVAPVNIQAVLDRWLREVLRG